MRARARVRPSACRSGGARPSHPRRARRRFRPAPSSWPTAQAASATPERPEPRPRRLRRRRRDRRRRRRSRRRRRRPCRCGGRASRTGSAYRIGMAPGLYFRHASSVGHETGAHPENKARIPAIENELERRDWLGWERREAPEVELAQLERIHPAAHVEHIRATAAAGGGGFDADTLASAGSWEAALHTAGGACAVVDSVMKREAPTAFAGLRPPGHHCEVERPMGFCLFNNVAVAAQHALDAYDDVERVAIFDWDVHHGNGTNDIFHSRRDVLYLSIHQSPLYPGSGPLRDVGSEEGEGYTVNMPAPRGAGEPIWLSLVQHLVTPILRAFEPGLILVSA